MIAGSGTGDAAKVAESCRAAVADLAIAHPSSPHDLVTVSVGVASLDQVPANRPVKRRFAALLIASDAALYRAKANGRSRVAR